MFVSITNTKQNEAEKEPNQRKSLKKSGIPLYELSAMTILSKKVRSPERKLRLLNSVLHKGKTVQNIGRKSYSSLNPRNPQAPNPQKNTNEGLFTISQTKQIRRLKLKHQNTYDDRVVKSKVLQNSFGSDTDSDSNRSKSGSNIGSKSDESQKHFNVSGDSNSENLKNTQHNDENSTKNDLIADKS